MRMPSLVAALLVASGLGLAFSDTASAQCSDCAGGGGGGLAGLHGPGECRNFDYGNPDLFYNFYVAPTCGGAGAELYLAPYPVPAHVGHTYITYQPLMPHEFLYKHKRTYHRYYNEGRGLTRTSVRWR